MWVDVVEGSQVYIGGSRSVSSLWYDDFGESHEERDVWLIPVPGNPTVLRIPDFPNVIRAPRIPQESDTPRLLKLRVMPGRILMRL